MSLVNELLKETIRNDYEFWLGCFQSDNSDKWKSGILHAYHDVICMIEAKTTTYCPCHICTYMRERKRKTDARC
jgi:hypothetical protein